MYEGITNNATRSAASYLFTFTWSDGETFAVEAEGQWAAQNQAHWERYGKHSTPEAEQAKLVALVISDKPSCAQVAQGIAVDAAHDLAPRIGPLTAEEDVARMAAEYTTDRLGGTDYTTGPDRDEQPRSPYTGEGLEL
jgi:hypothetical protein